MYERAKPRKILKKMLLKIRIVTSSLSIYVITLPKSDLKVRIVEELKRK